MSRAVISAVILGAAMGVAIPAAQGAVYLDTGFESVESPPYNAGNLVGQNGWGNATSDSSSDKKVVGGGGGLPNAPEGSQYAELAMLKNTGGYAQLQWNASQVTENFVVDVKMAYTGSPNSITGLYTQDVVNGFRGAIFGFQLDGTNGIKLAGRNGGNGGPGDDNYQFIGVAQPDTFYRFVATVRPADQQYDLTVYDDNGSLLGQLNNLGSRAGASQFSWLRAATGDVIGATLYIDDLTIASVPEPASLGLLGCAGILLCFRKR